MTPLRRCLLVLLMAAIGGRGEARADVAAVIAQARAYLGPEEALDGVKSVHFTGTMTTDENGGTAAIEIIFQWPYQQRIVATYDKGIETTGLDNYDGWQRIQEAKDPTRWRLNLLAKDQLKSYRANTWENLAFYRGIERIGGTSEDLGEATVDGIVCTKIALRHDEHIVFYRYFAKDTGRLVLTETAQGSTREEGSMVVSGVRFPQKVITTLKLPDGKEHKVTLTFDKITVNEVFDGSMFAVPSFAPVPPPADPVKPPVAAK